MSAVTQLSAERASDRDLHFQALFEGVSAAIGICHLDGHILEANPALCKLLGYSRQEMTGPHAREFYPELDRNFSPAAGPNSNGDLAPRERWLEELLRGERDSFAVERLYRRQDGLEFWGHLTVSAARDQQRQPIFLIALLADSTARKRTEEHLRQAEKMEVIGRLAGGIAHDFNNLLTGVLLYCDLLSAGFATTGLGDNRPGQEELSQHIDEVRMASEQGAALTHQLLAISRKQTADPRPTAINEVVASTKNLLRRLIGERVELILVLDQALNPALNSGAGLVLADPAQLRQILLNLVLNARDAMPQGGKIVLITREAKFPSQSPSEVSNESIKNESIKNVDPGAPRRAVSLLVRDNGCGMNAETRARLFEPFFTTKNPGIGTGLGLATVQRIVAELAGRIELDSKPGCGTSIEVLLPAIEPGASGGQITKPDSS